MASILRVSPSLASWIIPVRTNPSIWGGGSLVLWGSVSGLGFSRLSCRLSFVIGIGIFVLLTRSLARHARWRSLSGNIRSRGLPFVTLLSHLDSYSRPPPLRIKVSSLLTVAEVGSINIPSFAGGDQEFSIIQSLTVTHPADRYLTD